MNGGNEESFCRARTRRPHRTGRVMTTGSSTPRTTRRRARTSGSSPTRQTPSPSANLFRCFARRPSRARAKSRRTGSGSPTSPTNRARVKSTCGRLPGCLRLRHQVAGLEHQWSSSHAGARTEKNCSTWNATGLGDKVMAVPIGAAPNPAGTPTAAVRVPVPALLPQANVFLYSPAADGQRFLDQRLRHRGPTLARGDPELGQHSKWQVVAAQKPHNLARPFGPHETCLPWSFNHPNIGASTG